MVAYAITATAVAGSAYAAGTTRAARTAHTAATAGSAHAARTAHAAATAGTTRAARTAHSAATSRAAAIGDITLAGALASLVLTGVVLATLQ